MNDASAIAINKPEVFIQINRFDSLVPLFLAHMGDLLFV